MAAPIMRKVLVANRGEIGLRVIRACRARGMATVSVYSDADRAAPHALAADEAYRIGGGPAVESYLRIPAVIDAARRSGADAVHPGCGLLAQSPAFALACADAGVTFIGPPAETLARCRDAAETRRVVGDVDVPLVPWTAPVDDAAATAAAASLGFPVLIKAAAGRGGASRRVTTPDDLPGALRLARAEARAAFGDDRIYLERWLGDPRLVEVQIAADAYGGVIHLGERECSIRRRRQKVIEEAPSPALDAALRAAIGEAAVAAARAVGYRNVGTVRFLVDARRFFFLGIRARLQVEHPVTECVTGIDLVGLQFELAAGARLPWRQEDVALNGHAIECRIFAEDPLAEFVPWAGRVDGVSLPGGPGIRIDGAVAPGMEVTHFYREPLAKVIAWGPTRPEAIARMDAALGETVVTGLPTTLPFHRWTVRHPAFVGGRYSTRFVDAEWLGRAPADPWLAALAAAVLAYREDHRTPLLPSQDAGAWKVAARREAVS